MLLMLSSSAHSWSKVVTSMHTILKMLSLVKNIKWSSVKVRLEVGLILPVKSYYVYIDCLSTASSVVPFNDI